jgi:hypothetical protein
VLVHVAQKRAESASCTAASGIVMHASQLSGSATQLFTVSTSGSDVRAVSVCMLVCLNWIAVFTVFGITRCAGHDAPERDVRWTRYVAVKRGALALYDTYV